MMDASIQGSGALIEPLKMSARARQPPPKVLPPVAFASGNERIAWNRWLSCQISGSERSRRLAAAYSGPRKLHGFTSPESEIEQTVLPAPHPRLG